MVDTVVKIMAGVLDIIGIATKEIKQGRTSRSFLYNEAPPLTGPFSEKYLKKLFGNRTDVEDALKRLDILTQEEAQMAAAQVLKATHTVDDTGRVRGVADIALSVDNRVAGVSEQVQGIGDQVQGVDDKVSAAMDGAYFLFSIIRRIIQFMTRLDVKNATVVMQQAADNADQAKRS
jgi:hypothetical protein